MFTKWWTGSSFNARGVTPANSELDGKRRKGRMRYAASVVLAVSLVLASGCSMLPPEDEEEVLPEITPPQISKKPEYEVTTTTLETKVSSSSGSKLMSTQEETLFFTLDGKRLKTLSVKPGDKVAAGQLIAELDVEAMEKDLRQKRLQFRKAEVDMKETLRKRDEMDPIDFEQASIVFEEQRQAIVDLENEIAEATLTAPFAGTVVQLSVQKGDAIKAYDPICIIADTSRLVVAAKISKDDLTKVTVGMPAVVNINSAGEFKGTVKQLPMNTADDSQGGGGNPGNPGGEGNKIERPEDYLQIDIGAMPEGVTRGTPLSVNIITNRKENAIVIPLSALRSIGSRTYVQVVDENGKREVDVAVGQQTATQAEILEGLTPGQKVVGR
jgi:multidrug efflux pump subunit AcrA (membrane-fusion protein)